MSLSQNTREVKPSTWLLFNPGGVGPYDLILEVLNQLTGTRMR